MITLTLTGYAHSGDALGRLPDGRACFVPFGIVGEEVSVEIVEEAARFVRARLLNVLKPAPTRVAPMCSHFTTCGICRFQHLLPEGQHIAKTDMLRDQLTRVGKVDAPNILPLVSTPASYGYRAQIAFPQDEAGRLSLPMLETGLFPVEECPVLIDSLADLWPTIELEPIPDLRHIQLRAGVGDEPMLIFNSRDPIPAEFEVDFPLSAAHVGPDGIFVMSGDESVRVQALGREFQVNAGASFPPNLPVWDAMLIEMTQNLPESIEHALDLFAGVGWCTAALAERAARVTAIEPSSYDADDLVVNLGDVDNVELYEGSPVEVLMNAEIVGAELVVATPPPAGLGKDLLRVLSDGPVTTLITLSTNHTVLGRDAKMLRQHGWHLEHITPYDGLPQTAHVWSVGVWVR